MILIFKDNINLKCYDEECKGGLEMRTENVLDCKIIDLIFESGRLYLAAVDDYWQSTCVIEIPATKFLNHVILNAFTNKNDLKHVLRENTHVVSSPPKDRVITVGV
ncbi:uncharacterized protein VNE69_06100 [Vairimorpha necatrix]|uniref:Uncharacterized protein n=1 Tax=Vairimorpha necatrix TaxID=6039 RepID=A0AAX4JCV1_9MICR